MKNTKLILIFLFVLFYSCVPVFAQQSPDTTSLKYLINKGQEAYSSGDYSLSNDFYGKALMIDSENYDAKYAIAENYYKLKQYDKSLENYQILLDKNPENIDVLNGMARSYTRMESYDKAMACLKRSLSVNDRDPSVYCDLAFLYIVDDKLDSAKYAYQEALKIDSTDAEAWAGIGKMYYWQDKPASAIKYYRKALQLDPENPEIKTKYANVKNELAYSVKATLMYLTEEEPSSIKDKPAYKISAAVQKYGFEKRLTDHFSIAAFTLWDYSQRDNLYLDDVRRWYDNTLINPVFLLKSHRISVFAGASINDSRITAYGATWSFAYNIKKFKVRNYLTAAYDYFYYWNKVGHNYLQNTLILSYRGIVLSGTYRYSTIRNNDVFLTSERDTIEKRDNPNTRYNIELKYESNEILKNPKITIGVNLYNMDYKYVSPLYYSPSNRLILGGTISEYYKYKGFYNYFEFMYGRDNFKTDQYNGSLELGYELKKTSFSLGGSYFYNKYYQSMNIQFSVKQSF
ncbi:MAG TPA: tetratricopeptide repeat protein [Bacteroidales bacterium]|nr:tetratricopeptide repeat protein [Bacteroidales bacterium]